MLRSLGVLSALLAVVVSVDAAHIHVKVFNEKATTATTTTTTTTTSSTEGSDASATIGTVAPADTSSGSSDGYHMTTITSVQARVQGDAPMWDETNKIWVSKYGSTVEEQYSNVLDTVNTASVEGALMYVQAEGINVNEQSVKCQRKNNMQYVVFYEMTIVQPTYSIAYYGKDGYTPEYCPFVAMDGAKCTDSGGDLPQACKQYNGLDGELDLGPCVGSNLQDSDPRAPYPGNYWFSYPSSCVMELRADKTDACREKYPGGLCAMGVEPDGVSCSFSYKILGYSNIDDIVGITSMTDSLGNYYTNYTEFCDDGGIEFEATNTGNGFEVTECIDFWENPGDEDANTARFESMVTQYNAKAGSSNTTGTMTALPSIESLASSNPACYLNSPVCAEAEFGCKRTLYAQICEVCNSTSSDCVVAPSGFTFPTLSLPALSSSTSGSDDVEAGTNSAEALSDDSSAILHASTVVATVVAALVGVVML